MLSKTRLFLAGVLLLSAPLVFAFKSWTAPPAAHHKMPGRPGIEALAAAPAQAPVPFAGPRIQVALLIDVSGSMEGLLEQAKAQLWNLVSLLGKAECPQGSPRVEIALYEYGRQDDARSGYMRQLSPFTTDLDSLSKTLFALRTTGSNEYCPQVIFRSTQDLGWDTSGATYRAIFIAGNETFWQGPVSWTEACRAAQAKGIIVNTIYCGDRGQGITEHWNLAGECGKGSYTNINQNAQLENIATPYDSAIYTYNTKLNSTMIGYGYDGRRKLEEVVVVDANNSRLNKASGIKRMEVKGKKSLYRNDSWELVDAYEADSTILAKIDGKTLPDSLRQASPQQLKAVVKGKLAERETIRNEIGRLSAARSQWLETERKRRSGASAEATLETEMEKILKEQVKANGFFIR
ncbi:MAG: VWA domain-containing protein [Chitinophagaceae bacterium]|nr:MAG: VWA domain-containing protein [Chitinophagaceae bacterium]